MKATITKSPSGKYWSVYVNGKAVINTLTKKECEAIVKETLKRVA